MGNVKTINYFAAIPGRASHDDRLAALHFRVLMVIAGHDRMGRNGQCCWAGQKKLAARSNCHPKRLSTAISDLTSWGYLEAVQGEEDKRKRGYRVIYEAEQDAVGIGIEFKDNRLQNGNLSGESRLRVGNLSQSPNHEIAQLNQYGMADDPQTQYIQLKQNIDKRYTAEPASRGINHQKLYGPHTHQRLVEIFGEGDIERGWNCLAELSDDTLKWLEQRCSDDTLDVEDILAAKQELRERGAA